MSDPESNPVPNSNPEEIKSIADIKHGFYINLESRPDRKKHVEAQLESVGIRCDRFNAIRLANGAVGCSMSHLKCLQIAKANNWPHVLICEDDIQFLDPVVFCQQLNGFLAGNAVWDVVLLAGNNMPPYRHWGPCAIQVTQCQTTTGYLVKQHYYDKLIHNIKTGAQHLMKEPHRHLDLAIDKFWFHLQRADRWFLIVPLTVIQRQDYSDIERKVTNYASLMTDLSKDKLLNQLNRFRKMQL